MALEADVEVTDDVRLIRMECIGQHPRRAGGHVECVVVPLKRREPIMSTEPFVARCGLGRIDLDPTDFGRRRAKYVGTECVREQLTTETMSDHRNVAIDRFAQK